METASNAANKAKQAVQELRLNVAQFYQEQETRNLLQAEEAARQFSDDDQDCYTNGEKVYECVIGRSVCRMARSSMLALSLFCTIAVAVIVITVVLLCTFLSLTSSSDVPDDITNEDVVGVINWLHYPIGDLALRRANHTRPV
ncbi:unnamed protein product [Caenorhabditis auriculariae]|uniref:Uncharacterized protein n=1 Tax=Caenorhabditis auriculariae TaxID=2777116 RepID=A0A8S1H060_9PELO|nr:unnamed protein product [Caenorhabditis auriculariae]